MKQHSQDMDELKKERKRERREKLVVSLYGLGLSKLGPPFPPHMCVCVCVCTHSSPSCLCLFEWINPFLLLKLVGGVFLSFVPKAIPPVTLSPT